MYHGDPYKVAAIRVRYANWLEALEFPASFYYAAKLGLVLLIGLWAADGKLLRA